MLKSCAQAKEAGYANEAGQLEKAIQHLGATAMHLGQVGATGNLEAAMLQATPLLEMFGIVHLGLEGVTESLVVRVLVVEMHRP